MAESQHQGEEAQEYSSHKHQLASSAPSEERTKDLREALLDAYGSVIEMREVAFIRFGDLSAAELATAFEKHPSIIKATLCCVNVAQRAIKRDLGVDINTYAKRISKEHALLLAGYIKPFLPPEIAVPALMELDRYFWTDKEMRARKGTWEVSIVDGINSTAASKFRKRKFECDKESFELDAASPPAGTKIDIGIDVKRIESPRDIHKRADEILNKAAKFKKVFPGGKFYAVVYYPFPTQHLNVKSRLASNNIDGIFFAGESSSSIEAAVSLLVGTVQSGSK